MIKLFENKFFQFLIFVLLIVVIVFLLSSIANNERSSLKETMTVQGEGEVYAVPDIGLIDIAVLTESKTVEGAMSENTKKMNNIIEAFKKDLGIDEKDLKTTSFNINPRYEWQNNAGKRYLVGYEVRQIINVKIRDLSEVGDIIQKATDLGANDISELIFTFDNDQKLKENARNIAIKNAKEKAKNLEKELGVRMIRIVDFSESAYAPPVTFRKELMMNNEMAKADYAAATIEAGQNKITSNVSITYIIK